MWYNSAQRDFSEARVRVCIDIDFLSGGLIGVHPCDNTATVWLRTEELIAILRKHGNEVVAEQL